jgi:hypothetical protein
MNNKIYYKDGYKYQLNRDYEVTIEIRPEQSIDTEYIKLSVDGLLWLKEGYAWDGPSGPTIDTKNFMRGSLVHDALYQLIREKHLDKSKYRPLADKTLYEICRQDGMSYARARVVFLGVKWFADPAADPANDRKLIEAP